MPIQLLLEAPSKDNFAAPNEYFILKGLISPIFWAH